MWHDESKRAGKNFGFELNWVVRWYENKFFFTIYQSSKFRGIQNLLPT